MEALLEARDARLGAAAVLPGAAGLRGPALLADFARDLEGALVCLCARVGEEGLGTVAGVAQAEAAFAAGELDEELCEARGPLVVEDVAGVQELGRLLGDDLSEN